MDGIMRKNETMADKYINATALLEQMPEVPYKGSLRRVLMQAPAADVAPVQRWIPVTERLPEEDGWYQVYAPQYSGGSSSGLKNINGNMYSAFKHGKWSIEVGYHKRPGCVKAWMPLPEPPVEVDEWIMKK